MLELNKIHLCNCLDGLRQLDDNSIDLVITSPPYNLGNKISGKTALFSSKVDYDTYSDNMKEDEYKYLYVKAIQVDKMLALGLNAKEMLENDLKSWEKWEREI